MILFQKYLSLDVLVAKYKEMTKSPCRQQGQSQEEKTDE